MRLSPDVLDRMIVKVSLADLLAFVVAVEDAHGAIEACRASDALPEDAHTAYSSGYYPGPKTVR